MTVTDYADVALGDCIKGTDYTPDPITMRLNGAIYPGFASFTDLECVVRKNDANGAIVFSTKSIVNGALALISVCQIASADTAGLDCERLYWTCKATNGSGQKVPLCRGVIRVRPETTY